MFNKEIKNRFIENMEKKEAYIELFNKSSIKENELEKDLFDFSLSELMTYTENKRELVLIRNYIDWSSEQGLARTNINPLFI